jgi:hypothetical protein
LGGGIGVLLAGPLSEFGVLLLLLGILVHGWGMYDKHRLQRAADARQVVGSSPLLALLGFIGYRHAGRHWASASPCLRPATRTLEGGLDLPIVGSCSISSEMRRCSSATGFRTRWLKVSASCLIFIIEGRYARNMAHSTPLRCQPDAAGHDYVRPG